MYPVLFRIGNFPITSFGLMMFLSFIAGAWAVSRMLRRYGLDPELIWDMLAWIAVGGVLGAKIYYLALHPDELQRDFVGAVFSRGGLVWYGGLIGGVLAYFWQVRKRKLPMAVMYDACAPGLMLSIAIGRVGCFLVGDDYGRYTDGPFGVAFPEGAPPSTAGNLRFEFGDQSIPASIADSAVVPVHPTQLYEVAIVMPMFFFLWQLGKRRLKPGQLFAVFLGMYAVERFFLEFVRAKGDRFVMGLSTSQLMSILTLIGAIVLWVSQKKKPDWDPSKAPASVRAQNTKPHKAVTPA